MATFCGRLDIRNEFGIVGTWKVLGKDCAGSVVGGSAIIWAVGSLLSETFEDNLFLFAGCCCILVVLEVCDG